MQGIASCTLVGRLTGNPKVRQFESRGDKVTALNFDVAVNRRRKVQGSSEYAEATSYFRCDYIGYGSEALGRMLTMGDIVAIVGDLEMRKYTDKDTGKMRSVMDVKVHQLQIVSQRRGRGGDVPEDKGEAEPPGGAPDDSDIPW